MRCFKIQKSNLSSTSTFETSSLFLCFFSSRICVSARWSHRYSSSSICHTVNVHFAFSSIDCLQCPNIIMTCSVQGQICNAQTTKNTWVDKKNPLCFRFHLRFSISTVHVTGHDNHLPSTQTLYVSLRSRKQVSKTTHSFVMLLCEQK